jgi:hypothetical protein
LKISTHTRLGVTLAALLAAAFLLTACGGAPPTGWAGARIAEDVVYTGTSVGKVMAFDANTGALKWQFPKDKTLTSVYATPALANGVLYFGAFDHKFYALDAVSGEKKWEFDATAPIVSSAAVSESGIVYFGANSKRVYALETATGAKKWEFETQGEVWADVTLAGEMLYAASLDHKVYALDAASRRAQVGIRRRRYRGDSTDRRARTRLRRRLGECVRTRCSDGRQAVGISRQQLGLVESDRCEWGGLLRRAGRTRLRARCANRQGKMEHAIQGKRCDPLCHRRRRWNGVLWRGRSQGVRH